MRYFFHIGYKGTAYNGWQRHPNGLGVQQVVERGLAKILKVPVSIVGCSRTDAQVHATQFFFHVDVAIPWGFDMVFRLNKVLPDDIAVFDVLPMEGLPHARFDATSRSYDYFIHRYKDPFLSTTSALYLLHTLNLEAMQAAAALLPHYSNYQNLCRTPAVHHHTICHVTAANWVATTDGSRLRFHISANRYLGGMIRILVGKLLQIGTGTLSHDAFESYLATETAPKRLTPAYPQGLHLSNISYPYLNLLPRSTFAPIPTSQPESDWSIR